MTKYSLKKGLAALTLAMTLNALQGCATNSEEIDTGLYLRSEFTWWEARPTFKFKLTDVNTMVVSANIVPDGQAYHIKIADSAWSQSKNCGPAHNSHSEIILDTWLALECNYDARLNKITPLDNAFTFKPTQAGTYKFTLSHNQLRPTQLKVELKDNRSSNL